MKADLNIIKIGGKVLDDPDQLAAFLQDFAALNAARILVHGGGSVATAFGDRLGIESRYEQGRRITDAATLELVTMVYGGLINKQVVARLQALGCNAIGMTGADADIVRARRRPAKAVDYGFVGDVERSGVGAAMLDTLLRAGLTPVVAPLTHDGDGGLLNTNADTMAQEIAGALALSWNVRLIYCFEKPGVLRDAGDDESVIRRITRPDFEALVAEGVITGGMIPKLQNAVDAVAGGISQVVIGGAASLAALVAGTKGTQVQ